MCTSLSKLYWLFYENYSFKIFYDISLRFNSGIQKSHFISFDKLYRRFTLIKNLCKFVPLPFKLENYSIDPVLCIHLIHHKKSDEIIMTISVRTFMVLLITGRLGIDGRLGIWYILISDVIIRINHAQRL